MGYVQNIRKEILTDDTPFAGSFIDKKISEAGGFRFLKLSASDTVRFSDLDEVTEGSGTYTLVKKCFVPCSAYGTVRIKFDARVYPASYEWAVSIRSAVGSYEYEILSDSGGNCSYVTKIHDVDIHGGHAILVYLRRTAPSGEPVAYLKNFYICCDYSVGDISDVGGW